MAKHGQRTGRRLQQSGMGGGQSVVRIVPRHIQRKLPRLVTLSDTARFRLQKALPVRCG